MYENEGRDDQLTTDSEIIMSFGFYINANGDQGLTLPTTEKKRLISSKRNTGILPITTWVFVSQTMTKYPSNH